jgi:hypothetical protein
MHELCILFLSKIIKIQVKLQYHFPDVSCVGNTVQTYSYEFHVVGHAMLKRLINHHGNHVHTLHAKNHRMK